MTTLTKYGLLTIGLNFLILIGIGHGGIFFVFIEYFSIQNIISHEHNFSLTGTYEERLLLSGLLSLIGQIILAAGLLVKNPNYKVFTIYLSVFILVFSFVVLVSGIFRDSIDSFPFWTGIPFIIAITFLTISNIKMHKLCL